MSEKELDDLRIKSGIHEDASAASTRLQTPHMSHAKASPQAPRWPSVCKVVLLAVAGVLVALAAGTFASRTCTSQETSTLQNAALACTHRPSAPLTRYGHMLQDDLFFADPDAKLVGAAVELCTQRSDLHARLAWVTTTAQSLPVLVDILEADDYLIRALGDMISTSSVTDGSDQDNDVCDGLMSMAQHLEAARVIEIPWSACLTSLPLLDGSTTFFASASDRLRSDILAAHEGHAGKVSAGQSDAQNGLEGLYYSVQLMKVRCAEFKKDIATAIEQEKGRAMKGRRQ